MKIKTYQRAEFFLKDTRAELESNEAANGLMLGICGQRVQHPERFTGKICLKSVVDHNGLVIAGVMTPPHKLVVYAHQGDLNGGANLLIEALLREGWQIPGVFGPGQTPAAVAESWAQATGNAFIPGQRQRVYELRQVMVPPPARGRLRPATQADLELAARWNYAFHEEIFGQANLEDSRRAAKFRVEAGDIYLWQDGRPVSMAMRTRPTRHGISVSLVYTPPELRRKGYATACVGELSRSLLKAGRQFCALFADLSNPTSNSIYQKIGYRPVCDYEEYAFAEGGAL